jgi:hypothetical protein
MAAAVDQSRVENVGWHKIECLFGARRPQAVWRCMKRPLHAVMFDESVASESSIMLSVTASLADLAQT